MKKALLILALASLLASSLALSAAALPSKGKSAPDFTLKSLDGETEYTLSDLRGQVVYIDFWASWCGPCRRAFPEVQALHNEYKERGFLVLAVSLDRKVEAAVSYMEKQRADFPSVFDEKGKVATKYGVRSIPSAVLVDTEGNVAYQSVGFDQRKLPQLKESIEALLPKIEVSKDEKKGVSRLEAEGNQG